MAYLTPVSDHSRLDERQCRITPEPRYLKHRRLIPFPCNRPILHRRRGKQVQRSLYLLDVDTKAVPVGHANHEPEMLMVTVG